MLKPKKQVHRITDNVRVAVVDSTFFFQPEEVPTFTAEMAFPLSVVGHPFPVGGKKYKITSKEEALRFASMVEAGFVRVPVHVVDGDGPDFLLHREVQGNG